MTFGELMGFVRVNFPGNENRNGSILKQLIRRYGADETEAMVRGAALRGWTDLRGLWATGGVGRRWALEVYYNSQKRKKGVPQQLRDVMKDLFS